MIKISPIKESYNNGLKVSGHAEFAPHGYDIVCAGISAITYSLYCVMRSAGVSVINLDKEDELIIKILNPSEKSNEIMEGFMIALADLEQDYPEFITMKEEDF